MGNRRFRLSDMIPNSWFYKLRDMSIGRPRNINSSSNNHRRLKHCTNNKIRHAPSSSLSFSSSSTTSSSLQLPPPADQPNHSSKMNPHLSDGQRKSYYYSRPNSPTKLLQDQDLPRKSSRTARRRSLKRPQPPSRHVSTTISARCSCRASLESVWTTNPPDSTPEEYLNTPDRTSSSEHDSVVPECGSDRGHTTDTFDDDVVSCSTTPTCKCKAQNDIVFEIDDDDKHLPPIITKNVHKPTKVQRTSAEFSEINAYGSLRVKVVKEDLVTAAGKGEHVKTYNASPVRRFPLANPSSPGVRLRTNSPRILNRRRKSTSSRLGSVSESSFAVVKSSKDPRRDFMESMVEMIVEKNIRASKDLEELLACYLSLNSDEYHDLIINVFKQIWFDIIVHVRLE